MNKTLILLTAAVLLFPLEALAYKGHRGDRGLKDEFRQSIKAKIQEHQKQQQAQNKDFRESLKRDDIDQERKVAAIKEHRQTQYEENVAFSGQLHQEIMEHLTRRLQGNTTLTEEQKQKILSRKETQYQDRVAFRNERHRKSMAAVDEIIGNPNLTPEERKIQMKEYRKERKTEGRSYRKEKREENREFRRSFRPESEE